MLENFRANVLKLSSQRKERIILVYELHLLHHLAIASNTQLCHDVFCFVADTFVINLNQIKAVNVLMLNVDFPISESF